MLAGPISRKGMDRRPHGHVSIVCRNRLIRNGRNQHGRAENPWWPDPEGVREPIFFLVYHAVTRQEASKIELIENYQESD
jgi:hypothetical protein